MKILQKNRSLFFSISLIVIGSFLEIFYYSYRFLNDGISIWLSIVIGIALTLLLSLAVFKRKQKIMWLIIIPVSLYSILATSAGQSFSLGIQEEIKSEETAQQIYIQEEIKETRLQLESIDLELSKLNTQIAETVSSLEDRYEWKFTLANAEERIDELKIEQSEYKKILNDLRDRATIHEDVEKATTNIYEFYHKLFGWEKKLFQFILHTILSAFIAAMSPIGIITLNLKDNRKSNQSLRPYIHRWIQVNWAGYRTKRSETILKKDTFDKFMKQNAEPFSTQKYNLILKTAQDVGALNNTKFNVNEAEAEKLIVNKLYKKVLTKNE